MELKVYVEFEYRTTRFSNCLERYFLSNTLRACRSGCMFNLTIKSLQTAQEIHLCAQAMSTSEPWLTLRRGYEESLKILQDPAKEVYVAYGEGGDVPTEGLHLVGFLIVDMRGPLRGYIQTVCIMPEWRGQGAGSKLVAFAEERIFRESPNVFMCVSSFNQHAQRLYERLGYERVGVMKNYIVSGHDEILLRKTLAPWSEFRSTT